MTSSRITPRVGDEMQLAAHYARFRVRDRVLLTGHSHQAWPDVAFDAQQQAWLDAAELVDDKWERAALVADEVRDGWRRLLNEPSAEIAFGQNTHELVTRLLSAVLGRQILYGHFDAVATGMEVRNRERLVTTDGEFHTIRRQIDRLEEAGVEVTRVGARPVDTLAERLAATIDDRVACVMVSSVLFETAEIVPHLNALANACAHHGTTLLIDAYHHLNVVPFDVGGLGLEQAFITGGGYKYCQLGEGNCFLRVPPECTLRPILTGWFSEFAELADARTRHEVRYGQGAARFAGATYDPTSHYRATAVFDFHVRMELTPDRLREISMSQTQALERAFRNADVDRNLAEIIDVPAARRAGFVAIRSPHAGAVVTALRQRGVFVDSRGDTLRLGPAPYVSGGQLQSGVDELAAALKGSSRLNPTD